MADESLMRRLQQAATEALAGLEPNLGNDPHRLRAIMLELEISNAGELIESSAWVELKLGTGRRR
jgi:hypothetical protein